jgi:hypothetical protein
MAWANGIRDKETRTGVLVSLPAYALTYDPTEITSLGKTLNKVLGITGSPGYYYSPANPVQP